jgi:hypothetical protein
LKRTKRFDLLINNGIITVSHQPRREPAFTAHFVANASQLAMACIRFKAQPEPAQIPFVALVNAEKMTSSEHQHPRYVQAFVVSSCRGDDFVEATCRK